MTARRDHDEDASGFRAHMETRIDNVERELGVLGKRFEKGFSDINTELRAIGTRIAAAPNFEIGKVLAIVLGCCTLLGMGSASIVFIATSISSAPLARLEERLIHERERVGKLERLLERIAETKVATK